MPASTTFTGIGISLQSVIPQIGGAALRVRFTTVPQQVTPAGAHDALNPANYTVTGPSAAAVSSVSSVGGDPQSVTVVTTSPLPAGVWTLTVANIQTPGGQSLIPPTSLSFLVSISANATELTAGASNDDAEKIIRKHLSQAMQGDNWNALIAGLAVGDDINWKNAELAFDQLFEVSASGKYLDRLGANRGIQRPIDVGLSDDLYRQLLIALNSNKLTHEALREILAIFYGQDALRAWAETSLEEPFALVDGTTLNWELDETANITTTFSTGQFTHIGAATALEVASVLTKAMADAGSSGYAAAVTNPTTGGKRVRIYSGSLGLKSFVRVTGGTSQPFLHFPLYKEVYSGTVNSGLGYNWVYTKPSQNVTRLTLTTTGQPLIDISSIQTDDYVIIGPAVGVTPGSYHIAAVSYSWSGASLIQSFDLDTDLGFNGTILQQGNNDYRFFTPQKQTTLNGARTVVVAQVQPGQVDIQIPATTQAVSRTARTAAYGRDNATTLPVKRYVRDGSGTVTIELQSALSSPLTVGSQIFLEGFQPAISRPWVSPGVPGTYPSVATADASYGICLSATQTPPSANKALARPISLLNGDILITGGLTFAAAADAGESAKTNRFRLGTISAVNDASEANGASRFSYQWLATADMNTARFDHRQSLLADGRVLATGGMTSNGSGTVFNNLVTKNSPELYAPAANTWTNVAPMTLPRTGHTQITASNGKVIVMGGAWNMGTATSSVEVFDPTTMTWSAGAAMALPRYHHRAVTLPDGRIFVTGGRQLGQQLPLPTSVAAYWTMDDGSAPTFVNDAVGSWPLTVHGTPTIINGKVNTARDFTVANTWADEGGFLNDAAAISLTTGQWTVEFWLPAGAGTDGVILQYSGPATAVLANNALLEIGLVGGKLYWKWQNGAGVNVTQTATASLAGWGQLGAWIAVRKKFNGLSYDVSWWLNGQLMDTWLNQANANGGTNAQWSICANQKSAPVQSGGSRSILDEIRVSNIALDDATIVNDYLMQAGWVWSTWNLSHFQGNMTDRTAFYDPVANTWTEGPKMQFSRALHQMHVLPDGQVLVFGGVGRDLSAPLPIQNNNWTYRWPNVITPTAEIWNPTTNRWRPIPGPMQNYVDAASVYVPGKNQIIVTNDQLQLQAFDYSSGSRTFTDPWIMEAFDCATKTWSMLPIQNTSDPFSHTDYGIHAGSDVVLITGGVNGAIAPYTNMTLVVPGVQKFSGGGMNGIQRVVASTTQFVTISTPSYTSYASNYGDASFQGGQIYDTTNFTYDTIYSGYKYQITNFQRTTNVATLTLNTTAGLSVGQPVYVNINTNVPMGIKTLLSVTPTTVTYADTGANVASTPTTGVLDINQNPGAALRLAAVPARPATDPGPYIFDPNKGLSIVGVEVSLSTAILTGQQVGTITVSSNANFPNQEGYIVLEFGKSTQSKPIKYLGKFGTTTLIVDFSYVVEHDYGVGATVTLLQGRTPFVPADPLKSANFYITGSTVGRIAAQNFLAGAAAAGIALSVDVVYPGDRGLGAEGYPTQNAPKLSDIVRAFGGDNLDGEGL